MPTLGYDYTGFIPPARMAFDSAPRRRMASDDIDPSTAMMTFLREHCRLSDDDLQVAEEMLRAVKAAPVAEADPPGGAQDAKYRRLHMAADARRHADADRTVTDMFPGIARIGQAR